MLVSEKDSNAPKRPLLPSELKKQLRTKRANTSQGNECFKEPKLPISLTDRKPFAKISTNPTVESIKRKLIYEKPRTSWCLLEQVSISTGSHILEWRKDVDNTGSYARLNQHLNYYRFPFPKINSEIRNILPKVIQGNKDDPLIKGYFKSMTETWRKSLLSLYNGLKSGEVSYFYYLEQDLIVLFQGKLQGHNETTEEKFTLKAIVTKTASSLMKKLSDEGIKFQSVNDDYGDSTYGITSPRSNESTLPDHDDDGGDGQENIDPKSIKAAINERIQNKRYAKLKKGSASTSILMIDGDTNVHNFIDFLINQKDGKSYCVMPELISPEAFLFGTLCKSEISVVGPIKEREYQVKVSGLVTPTAMKLLVDATHEMTNYSENEFKMANKIDERTEGFLAFHL